MDQRLTIITLGVENVDKATRFYEDCFGWNKKSTSNGDITFFQLNGILLSLYSREALADDACVDASGSGFKGISLAFNCRSETEVDNLFAELETKNVSIVKKPHKVFWGGYSGYISDLDGHLWEIAYNPYLPMDRDGNV